MNNKLVEIYSTSTCHFCQMAKEFFTANGIEFTDYNVGLDPERRAQMVEITGQLGVPVIVISDPSNSSGQADVVIGFDEKTLRKILELPA